MRQADRRDLSLIRPSGRLKDTETEMASWMRCRRKSKRRKDIDAKNKV